MGEFKPVPHTADLALWVKGENLVDLFETAARGMFSLLTDLKGIKEEETRQIQLEGENWEDLMVRWLNELLYLQENGYLFSRFKILNLTPYHLQAILKGEKIKPHHSIQTEIKAATYHGLRIDEKNPEITLIFDV